MTDESNIQPLQPDFEQIKKRAENGKEYWSARDLSTVLGYSTWQKFNRVLNKALQVAQNRGMDMSEHFNQVVEMVKLGSGTFREVDNFHLSRIACLIIAENADGKKPQVQAACVYFKEQTTTLELIENQIASRILIYKTNQGETRIEVLFNGKTFWLTQKRMGDLYDVDVSTINYHLGNIFETGELKENAVIRKIPITAADGKDYDTMIYNLDAIIAVGYRVNSYKATQFRIWATEVLREFIIKGADPQDTGHRPGIYLEFKEPHLNPENMEQRIYDILDLEGWNIITRPAEAEAFYVDGKVNVGHTNGKVILQTFSNDALSRAYAIFQGRVPMCYLLWLNTPPEPGDFALTTPDGYAQAINWALANGAHIIGPSIAGEPNNYDELNAPWQAQLIRRSGMLNHPYSFDTQEQMRRYVGTDAGDIAADGCFTNRSEISLQYMIDNGFRCRKDIPDPFHPGSTYDNSQASESVPDAVQTLERLGYHLTSK